MSENSAKNIRNGVIASVIAGIILMLIPSVRSYAAEFFLWTWSIISGLWRSLWAEHLVSGWVILLVTGMALVGLLAILISLREVFGKRIFIHTPKTQFMVLSGGGVGLQTGLLIFGVFVLVVMQPWSMMTALAEITWSTSAAQTLSVRTVGTQ